MWLGGHLTQSNYQTFWLIAIIKNFNKVSMLLLLWSNEHLGKILNLPIFPGMKITAWQVNNGDIVFLSEIWTEP